MPERKTPAARISLGRAWSTRCSWHPTTIKPQDIAPQRLASSPFAHSLAARVVFHGRGPSWGVCPGWNPAGQWLWSRHAPTMESYPLPVRSADPRQGETSGASPNRKSFPPFGESSRATGQWLIWHYRDAPVHKRHTKEGSYKAGALAGPEGGEYSGDWNKVARDEVSKKQWRSEWQKKH